MVSMTEIQNQIWEIFDNLGLVEKAEEGEILLHNEQIDSVQLISIIVEIEEKLMIEIPDEYMVPEFVSSFDHVCNVVMEVLEKQKECEVD